MLSIRLLLLFCVVVWGWTFVATKICLAYMGPIELVGARFLIGLPLLYAVIRFRRIRLEFAPSEVRSLGIGSAVITVHFLMQAVALMYTSATKTGWIIAVTPLVLAALSVLILRERMGYRELGAIIVATFGIILLVSQGKIASFGWLASVGDWLILASAHTWALYTIATRDVSRSRNPLTVTLVVFLPLTLLCFLYFLFFRDIRFFFLLPWEPIVALMFLGVLGTLAQWFWQIGVARIGAAKAGIFLYLEPIATTALAIPLLNESLTTYTAVGGLMVMAGVWWAQRR